MAISDIFYNSVSEWNKLKVRTSSRSCVICDGACAAILDSFKDPVCFTGEGHSRKGSPTL